MPLTPSCLSSCFQSAACEEQSCKALAKRLHKTALTISNACNRVIAFFDWGTWGEQYTAMRPVSITYIVTILPLMRWSSQAWYACHLGSMRLPRALADLNPDIALDIASGGNILVSFLIEMPDQLRSRLCKFPCAADCNHTHLCIPWNLSTALFGSLQVQQTLTVTQNKLGDLWYSLGKLESAQIFYRQALQRRKALYSDQTMNLRAKIDYALSLAKVADIEQVPSR